MKILVHRPEIFRMCFCDSSERNYIITAATTQELTNRIVRVKSSNVWGYNIKTKDGEVGDVIVQFKSKSGGPGDVYIYYDVPVRVYRRWHSSPSKGHYFWEYIRNNFRYSKLTGD